jgi:hypothetical protein
VALLAYAVGASGHVRILGEPLEDHTMALHAPAVPLDHVTDRFVLDEE